MKKWWKWRPTIVYRVPRCVVRVDGGPEHAPMDQWEICGKKVSWCCGIWMNDPGAPAGRRADPAFRLWQTLVPLCKEHKNPNEQPVKPKPNYRWYEKLGLSIGFRLGQDTLTLSLHPLSWLYWGQYETDPMAFHLGPLCLRVYN